MKKNVKTILTCIFAVIGLVALGIGLFMMLSPKTTNKEIFTDALEKTILKLGKKEDASNNDFLLPEAFYKEDAIIQLVTNNKIDMIDGEEAESFTLDGNIYSTNNKIYAEAKALNGLEKILDIEAFLEENKLYHKINDEYSRFYYTELDLVELTEQFSNMEKLDVDFSVILDDLVKSIISEVKEDKLTKEEKTITLGGQEFTADKVVATFTEKDAYKILKNFIVKLENNDDVKVLLEELTKNSKDANINFDELIAELDNLIDSADDKEKLFNYGVYLYGEDVLSSEIAISIESDDVDLTLKFVVNNYENEKGYNSTEAYISAMGLKIVGLEFHEVSEAKTDVRMYIFNTMEIKGSIQNKENNLSVKLNGTMEVPEDDGTTTKQDILELDLEGTEVSEEEYDINLAISFDYEGAALELESLNKYSIIEEMPEVDLSNSKPIEDMPEKEKEVYDMFFGNLDLIIDIEDDLEESL